MADACVVAAVERAVSLRQQWFVAFQGLVIFLVQAVSLGFQTVDGDVGRIRFPVVFASFDGEVVVIVLDVQACQLRSGKVVVGIAVVYLHVGAYQDVGV